MKVLLAISNPLIKKTVKDLLIQKGNVIAGEASNASDALRKGRHLPVDLIIMDTELEGGRVGQAAMIMEEDGIAPVLLLASQSDLEVREFSYILKPISVTNLIPAIESALASYRRRSNLLKEVEKLKNQIETRKMVEQAKAVLARAGMNEEDAHRYLQKISMDKGLPLVAVARTVIKENIANMKGVR